MGAITIGSYNIQKGVGVDLRRDLARTAEVLAEMDCDVIGLQEVLLGDGEAVANQARTLAERLGMTVVVGVTRPLSFGKPGLYGNAVLTRLPVVGSARCDLSFGGREPRGCLRVDVEAFGRTVHVHNCHFGLAPKERRFQLARLGEFLRESEGPRVVMGDFNEWYAGPVTASLWRELARELGAAAPVVPRTHPAFYPVFALDRLYCDTELAAGEMRAHRSERSRVASDHLPVVVRLMGGGAYERRAS